LVKYCKVFDKTIICLFEIPDRSKVIACFR